MKTDYFQGKDGYVWWNGVVEDRKDPLKREVRLASAKKTATAIAEQMLEKNIKKGLGFWGSWILCLKS